jgi:hypothetical protein
MKKLINNTAFFLKKETALISLYASSFVANLAFLIIAYRLNFKLIDQYIICVSCSTVLSSLFYSLIIKSKKKKEINLEIKLISIKLILIIFFFFYIYVSLNRFFYISIFFLTLILSEFLINLALVKCQLDMKKYSHGFIKIFQSLLKFGTLSFLFFTDDIIILGIINNLVIIIVFYSVITNYNFKINSRSKSFGVSDITYTLVGSLIFQLDKIIGPSYLDSDIIARYFINFKISSFYQIFGSIISQPIRNLLIKTKKINMEMKKNIKYVFYLLIFFYIFSNLILIILYKYNFLDYFKIRINLNDVIVYNIISLSFILHTKSGFYIDELYLNSQSKYLTKLNIICIIIIGFSIYLINNPIAWSASILMTQVLLLIFSQKIINILR